MAVASGEARKDLSADALFGSLRSRFASLPDLRSGEVEIPLADALMSAFAMFSLKDPSLLAFDHRRHNPKDNFRTIYGINRVPCDSQMRDILRNRLGVDFVGDLGYSKSKFPAFDDDPVESASPCHYHDQQSSFVSREDSEHISRDSLVFLLSALF